ncbi:MAG: hypothetical protein KBT12_05865 [Bacteroidales bacterium]|nr:hypothetical protein [Candidatus Physcousia equi]
MTAHQSEQNIKPLQSILFSQDIFSSFFGANDALLRLSFFSAAGQQSFCYGNFQFLLQKFSIVRTGFLLDMTSASHLYQQKSKIA